MDNLYWLDRIQSSDRPLVGNKAFNLSQLSQRGYPVLPGFVVPSSAFWEFIHILSESEPLLADLPQSLFHVDVDNPYQLQQVAQRLRQAIVNATLPSAWVTSLLTAAESQQASVLIFHPSLSLRLKDSEAHHYTFGNQPLSLPSTTAFAKIDTANFLPVGILESYSCALVPDTLILSLKRVWAELFRARSLFYWQRNSIELQQLNLAVLVQPVWEAIASGTIEADTTAWNIQATWGIGEALTKGEVLPDSYHLHKDTGTILSSVLGSKTRAYRLRDEQDSQNYTESGLQPYLVSDEQQNQYALDENYLKQLIELSRRLAAELTQTFTLEWTLCQPPGNSQLQLYVTQFIPQPRTIDSQMSMSSQPSSQTLTPAIVRGLPAATGRVTAPAYVLRGEDKNLEALHPGRILVAVELSPDWLPWLKSADGIITERGGMTSHAAIIARELGIPAIVSVVGVTQIIQTDEILYVDGDQGEIHRLGRQEGIIAQPSPSPHPPLAISYPPYPIATQLLVNLSQPDSLERIAGLPVDGVGLLRSEVMMLDALDKQPLSTWLRQGKSSELATRLAHLILEFASAFAPRPVFYRSLDWRSHELQLLAGTTSPSESEVNPIVGRRGTLRYMDDPTCFDLELEALAQVQEMGYANLHLMLPFVRTVEEFVFCRRRVEQTELTENPQFQLWIMAEVPSVLFLLPDYVKAGVQGISIGTNDLTQLLLATDRDRETLGSNLNSSHPAVKRALKQLIETAKDAGVPCSICGQAPTQYPELIDLLVLWGISSISVDINEVERTYYAIARAEQRLLLEAARRRVND
ncbi:MAG: phosphoenolpyruvate synthase [Coleofasciculaceae cyanobacterium]